MKKIAVLLIALPLLLFSCQSDTDSAKQSTSKNDSFSLLTAQNDAFIHENLRLYPILANADYLENTAPLPTLLPLSAAMQTPGFRVLEQKQFGRKSQNWYNGVTIQNKTQQPVLLLSGDIVKGGNQDRAIAQHQVIAPMSVQNVAVFCVEEGRSTYYNPSASPAEKQVAAFSGYYNVASPKVRRAIQKEGDQQAVWSAVATVTKANEANSDTRAYTALEQENAAKARRDGYLSHFSDIPDQNPTMVGMVVVCGNEVLGVDILSSPALFQAVFPGLLHGYVAEAATLPMVSFMPTSDVEKKFSTVAQLADTDQKETEAVGKFSWNQAWVHLFAR